MPGPVVMTTPAAMSDPAMGFQAVVTPDEEIEMLSAQAEQYQQTLNEIRAQIDALRAGGGQ